MLLESAPGRPIIFKFRTVLLFITQNYCNFSIPATFCAENLFPKFIFAPIFWEAHRIEVDNMRILV